MYLTDEKKEIMNNYINKSLLQKLLYIGRGLDIVEAFAKYLNAPYNDKDKTYRKLIHTLWKKDIKHINEIFKGKEYGALKLLLGDFKAEIYRDIWDKSTQYTYSSGYYRRSYRTNRSSQLYLERNIAKLEEFIYLAASDFSLDKYLTNNKAGYQDISVIADIIALEVDRNNKDVLDKIKEIVYSDNNTAILSREIIRGLLMSKNEEAHRIIGELLLAAKLQEGLRQAIVESIDEGSKKGFIYILRLIIDNNMMRFSSLARAFGTWTGLALDIERPKVLKKCFEAAYHCLVNEGYKKECMASDDNLLIYISLWAVAFDEVEDLEETIYTLLSSNEKYKKLVVLQFLLDTQFMTFKHEVACSILDESDLEVTALAIKNLFGSISAYNLRYDQEAVNDFYKLKDQCHGIELFKRLEILMQRMPKKEVEFKGSVFPWVDFKFTLAEILEKMILSVALSHSNGVIDKLIDHKEKMSVDTRQVFIEIFLKKPANEKQKLALIEACGDRSSSVRESAFKIVDSLVLTEEDYSLVENLLQYKSGDLRKSAIKLLLKQSRKELINSVNRLVRSGNENKRLAAIDMVSAMEGTVEHKDIYKQCFASITSMDLVSQKEKLLTKNIVKDRQTIKSLENGFGLYDRTKGYEVPVVEMPKNASINSRLSMTQAGFKSILTKFSHLIHENRDLEYETVQWDGTKTMITLGGSNYLQPFNRDNRSLDNYPIADKIRELIELNNLDSRKLIEMDFYIKSMQTLRYRTHLPHFEVLLEDHFNYKMLKEFSKTTKSIDYYNIIGSYISLLVEDLPQVKRFEMGKTIASYVYLRIPAEKHYKDYLDKGGHRYFTGNDFLASSHEIEYWLDLMKNNCNDDERFISFFSIAYNYYKASKFNARATLSLENFGRALELGIIDEHEVFKELIERPHSADNLATLTNLHKYDRNNIARYTRLIEIGKKVADTIANLEVKRGELNTEVSHLAAKIQKCYGVSIFTAILLASEKDTYVRGYNFVNGDCTKKQMFSHLLKCCYPGEGEDAKTLAENLKDRQITSKHLVEAAMYSPQWLDIVSDYLGFEGLKSACWYFHAHVNDYFSNEKSAIVARYTPISAQDLKEGAFDQQWFIDAYNTLGEKNFKLVYDSAKYIAGGGLHKRSQLFADATLGKLDITEVKKRLMDKRNKDYLLSYGLIPIKNKEDLLERYEYIHQYIKESKQFGAQRQASEGRSANLALLNLARNAGYADVNRLSWNMETARFHEVQFYLQPQTIEEIEIQLVIDERGQAELCCTKAGKELKSIPSKLKNHEVVLALKELKKSLKDQYVRARQSFESAMENGEIFKAEELVTLCENLVIAPIINSLVFKTKDRFGYVNGDSLVDYNNERYRLKQDEELVIAHPVHLYGAGCWSHYQKDIFGKKLVQPFKQVFRELYLPNADELKEQTQSRRYAGHQVQPKKTLALLKTRGWIANNDEGLQKIYYKENIIATLYVIADWFSPADIEAPILEFVRFEDRKTYKPVPLDKIPHLIFSEVMRDVDLVVSVAHVGGVDPEASLSTIEIRTVIVDEIIKLIQLSNVVLKGNHAHIAGIHGEYTVHLGSGVVHKMGRGSINILPVHSSHRGRIFLPFIDSDPKSAEIVSKIIFLAEDGKIKDPSVLEQIISL